MTSWGSAVQIRPRLPSNPSQRRGVLPSAVAVSGQQPPSGYRNHGPALQPQRGLGLFAATRQNTVADRSRSARLDGRPSAGLIWRRVCVTLSRTLAEHPGVWLQPHRAWTRQEEPKKDRMSLPTPATAQQDARNREPRVNHRIRVPEVRLVGVEGEQLGIVPIEEAMRMAQDAGVDLVEVAAAARPPVCKLMDYGKFKYTQKKKAQEQKRTSTHVEVKEVKLRPKTDEHDYQTKLNQARRFLQDGDRVKLTVMFRGREIAYARAQNERLMEMANSLADIAAVDVLPKVEGRNMSMMLNPKRSGGQTVKPAETPTPAPAPAAPTGPAVTTRGPSTRGG